MKTKFMMGVSSRESESIMFVLYKFDPFLPRKEQMSQNFSEPWFTPLDEKH
jgi:hypothetical protein